MKHNTKITILLILMFLVTQLIGLFVIQTYNNGNIQLPYGMQPPPEVQQTSSSLISILFAFIIAIVVFLLLTKIKAETFIRIWFAVVTVLALGLTFNAILIHLLKNFNSDYLPYLALVIAIPLAYIKIFKRNMLVHNFTELLIYPGIAAVFISLLNVLGIIILLLIISIYDIWAVWHSKVMQKMAQYQINTLKFFTGFFVPYASKKDKLKIRTIKEKYANKNEKFLEKKFKNAKIKVNLAILGGGDVVFPIIAAGVVYVAYKSVIASLIITLGATIAISSLFLFAKKKRFYPAMPYITVGIYLAMILVWTLQILHWI
jgi:presenilin-like A22 family membrane protease